MSRLETSKAAWWLFFAGSLALFGVECSWFFPEQSAPRVAAAWAWVFVSCVVLCCVLTACLTPFFRREFWGSRDLPWFLAALVVPVGLVLFGVNGWSFTLINGEGAQEVQSGFMFLTKFSDFGLFKMGFLGYPARQYLLAALPSYLWGKSLVALRMGFGALYLLGYVAFALGTWRYLESRSSPRPMLVAGLTGTLVSLGSYPLLFARTFEQTTVPMAVTFLFLGGLLLLLSRPGPLPALWAAWALGFLPYAYTPAYGAWAFAMVLLGCLVLSRPARQRLPLAVCLAYGAASFASSVAMLVRENAVASKVKVGGFENLVVKDWLIRMAGGFHATIGLEESLIPAPLLLGIVFVLVDGMRRRDFRLAWICAWAAGSVATSLALKGYCWRRPDFDIQRAMFILPVLGLAVGVYLSQNWARLSNGGDDRFLRVMAISAILVMILNSAYLPLIRRAPRDFDPAVMTDDEEATMLVLEKAAPDPRTIYEKPPVDCDLEDDLKYFSPDTAIVHGDPPDGEHTPGNYVISFISKDSATRISDDLVWHRNRRPFLRIKPE